MVRELIVFEGPASPYTTHSRAHAVPCTTTALMGVYETCWFSNTQIMFDRNSSV